MSGTDPSGYISLSKIFSPLLRPLIKLSSKILGPELTNAIGNILFYKIGGPLGSAYWTYNFTRAMGGTLSGALRGAFTAAVSSFAFQTVGANTSVGSIENILGNAVVGGVMSDLQGGKFGHGFWAAGFSAAGKAWNIEVWGISDSKQIHRVVTAAVLGGTGSVISGGKFANGAATGAFSQAFNGEESLGELRNKIKNGVTNFITKNGIEIAELGGKALTAKMLSTIYDNYGKVLGGNTVGLFGEGSAALLAAVQVGSMLAFDKTGISLLAYAGGGGAAGAGFKLSGGAFIYGGSRDGLVGWGGEVGSEVYAGLGGSISYIATGGESAGALAGGVGGKFSLLHGYISRTWEVYGNNFLD